MTIESVFIVPVEVVPDEGVVGVGEGVVVGGGLFTVTLKFFLNVARPPVGRSTSTSAV